MKQCSICHKISATDQDHLDCVEKRRLLMENLEFKDKIPEKLNISKNTQELGVEVRAILEHLSRNQDKKEEL